jgi:catechol 2,3-dioxygenase-like lactoylglutathione lyase family enzyme
MRVLGLGWLGTRTEHFDELVRFYRDGLRLPVDHEEPGFVVFRLPDGTHVEVFGPDDQQHRHFTTGPVAGFLVEDIDLSRPDLERAGAVFFGPTEGETGGYRWAHFRAPDGNVYELTEKPV